jgi:penicillin-binding protein 1A
MVDMLQGVVQEGTGRQAVKLGMAVGGKTGTTNDFRDALFVGFSPSISAGVWVGRDDFSPLGDKETGGRAALPIWISFMAATGPESTTPYFGIPNKMGKHLIDPLSGRAVADGTDGAVKALFVDGTEPGW